MLRPRNVASAFGVSTAVLLLLLAMIAPVSGGTASPEDAASQPTMGAWVPSQADCVQAAKASNTPIFEIPEGRSCKADVTPSALPDWKPAGGRTCRCSCGYPCKTDADCGGGVGSCRGGITCC